jgi:CBS domain-containing protein
MNLREIVRSKGSNVHTIAPTDMLSDAVRLMVENRCGSLVVAIGDQMVGIISERDILRTLAEVDAPLNSTPVAARMTSRVITGDPEDDLGKVMGIMTQNRIRHLPVVQGGKLAGVVSIGDIVKAQHEQLTKENHFLMSYIQTS